MGIRGELSSKTLILQNRTYFFNVKENRLGDLYLNIVESKNKETGGFERQSVIVFADDLPAFLKNFDEALKALEKAVREQRRGGGDRRQDRGQAGGRDSGRPRGRDPQGRDKESGQAGSGRPVRREGKKVVVRRSGRSRPPE
ncbi:MAG: DUF3276 family protein [Treponema sp.]|jgi:hypothetical protein|nr:DUF3276 family protein [Treponema sp.]